MKLAIVGSRTFSDYELLKTTIDQIPTPSLIVSGGARGADTLAEQYARERGIPTKIFLPDWKLHGKVAGFIRNELIVKECDFLVAFWDGKSNGTRNSISHAKEMKKEFLIVRTDLEH